MAYTTATIATIGTIAAIAGAATTSAAAVAQGQADKAQADFQAAVQLQQAEREEQLARERERDFRRDQSAALARRRAQMGASGVDPVGSPLLATEDFAREVELQAQRIRAGGEVSATRLQQQAELTRAAGAAQQAAGFIRGGSSLLTGTGRSLQG